MSIIRRFTLRLRESNYLKIDYIADKSKRSVNSQIEYIIENFITDYEKFNGKIDTKAMSIKE